MVNDEDFRYLAYIVYLIAILWIVFSSFYGVYSYMTKRIHSSLGYLTPLEFETAWRLAHPVQTTP